MAQERDREGEFDVFYRAYAGDVKAYCLRRADASLAEDARKVTCEEGLVLAELEPVDLAGHVRAVDARNRPLYRSRLPVAALRPRP